MIAGDRQEAWQVEADDGGGCWPPAPTLGLHGLLRLSAAALSTLSTLSTLQAIVCSCLVDSVDSVDSAGDCLQLPCRLCLQLPPLRAAPLPHPNAPFHENTPSKTHAPSLPARPASQPNMLTVLVIAITCNVAARPSSARPQRATFRSAPRLPSYSRAIYKSCERAQQLGPLCPAAAQPAETWGCQFLRSWGCQFLRFSTFRQHHPIASPTNSRSSRKCQIPLPPSLPESRCSPRSPDPTRRSASDR